MSRIGKKNIIIPKGVEVKVGTDHVVTVKGPRGRLTQWVNPDITIQIQGNELSCTRPTEQKRHKAQHGLYRSLIANMITGVTSGYKKTLEVVGLGYKALELPDNAIEIHVGYSHPIYFRPPTEIKVSAELIRGKSPMIHVEGNDKQLVGQVATKIRSLRKPEPYKGKGIRFLNEKIRRKAGKTATK